MPLAQRYVLVGYSHHSDNGDCPEMTEEVMSDVLSGRQDIAFFNKIPTYFDRDKADFWNEVVFFNFLPDIIGSDEERYGSGTRDQIARGRTRFLRILSEYRPSKVFVFSRRAWTQLPPTVEEQRGEKCNPLLPPSTKFEWGQYSNEEATILAFGLRHPQFAPDVEMMPAVSAALALQSIGSH